MTQIIPVIHYADDNQAMRNAELAFEAGCPGIMLIEMRGRDQLPYWVSTKIKKRWPDRLVGLNFLNASDVREMPICAAPGIDMSWTDRQLTHSSSDYQTARHASGMMAVYPKHLFFCGVAFKYQEPESDPGRAAKMAVGYGFIPTTSGPATGQEGDLSTLAVIREAIGPRAPLAIASGITPDNAHRFEPYVSHMLVATGISSTFHEFDPVRLHALVEALK